MSLRSAARRCIPMISMSSCTGDAQRLDVVLSGFFSSTRIFPNHTFDSKQRKLAEAALAQLGVSQLVERAVEEMSLGEAKRVSIAPALVHKPRALLFDEPCNSLDILAQRSRYLKRCARSRNGALALFSSRTDFCTLPPAEIERAAPMSKGRIVADGPKKKVLQAELLSKLFWNRSETRPPRRLLSHLVRACGFS